MKTTNDREESAVEETTTLDLRVRIEGELSEEHRRLFVELAAEELETIRIDGTRVVEVARPGREAIRIGALEIYPEPRRVFVEDREVSLEEREFDLLAYLAATPGRVRTKQELLQAVWGRRTFVRTEALELAMIALRRKLSRETSRFIADVWGQGYRLIDAGEPASERSAA
jgi:DNA-binding response OmpR family regulator